MRLELGSAVFTTFLYSLRSESKRIWILYASYLHVWIYLHTPFIRITCFIFAQIRIQISIWCKKIHVAANISFIANICLRFSHASEYLLQNISLEANIHKTFSEFHIQANFTFKRIFASKYLHTSKYSLANICKPANICFVLLQII